MTPIIAGRFEQNDQAEAAMGALRGAGFDASDVSVFFVNPPGQHATFPIGGDRDALPGAKHAESGALKGAAVGGVLVAVRAVEFAKRVDAVNVLRRAGARDIEWANGTWQAGHWVDFDPLKPPLLVDLPASEGVYLRN